MTTSFQGLLLFCLSLSSLPDLKLPQTLRGMFVIVLMCSFSWDRAETFADWVWHSSLMEELVITSLSEFHDKGNFRKLCVWPYVTITVIVFFASTWDESGRLGTQNGNKKMSPLKNAAYKESSNIWWWRCLENDNSKNTECTPSNVCSEPASVFHYGNFGEKKVFCVCYLRIYSSLKVLKLIAIDDLSNQNSSFKKFLSTQFTKNRNMPIWKE